MQMFIEKHVLLSSKELRVHVRVACLRVNTAVFVTCFLLLILVTEAVFAGIKFNVLQASLTQKEPVKFPEILFCATLLWSGHPCRPVSHKQRVFMK